MKPKRSKIDWVLEGMSVAALLAGLALAISAWDELPARLARRPFGASAAGFGPWTARNALWIVMLLNAGAYVGLTAAAHWDKLIHVPAELDRAHPHLRQLLFSLVIVLKAILTLFSLYLMWALASIGRGHGAGLNGGFVMLFVLLVPAPLIWYTVKLRRYR
jgi:hypothetical protein